MNYSSHEIAEILSSCRKNGVVSLEIGSIKCVFGEVEPKAPRVLQTSNWLRAATRTTPDQQIEIEAAQESTLKTDETRVRQDQVEDLILTDPQEYERRILNGDLTDEVPTLDS